MGYVFCLLFGTAMGVGIMCIFQVNREPIIVYRYANLKEEEQYE